MDMPGHDVRGRVIVALATGCTAALVAWAALRDLPVLVTPASPSIPGGVYLVLPEARWDRGSYVLFEPPAEVRWALEALTGQGSRPLWAKSVAAVAGDTVCASEGGLSVNGRPVIDVAPPAAAEGRPRLRGCEVVGAGKIYVAGQHARSFDSRYWGPVDMSRVVARLQRLDWLSALVGED